MIKRLLATSYLVLLCLVPFAGAAAFSASNDLFGGEEAAISGDIGLTNVAPQVVVARVINITLGFVGIIFVGLVVYGGWLWMTSAGEAQKIEQAKKLLTAAVIGLILVLSSWGIARFIVNKMNSSIGPGSVACTDGAVKGCGCGGTSTCSANSWGACVGSSCATGVGSLCDGNPMTSFDPSDPSGTCEPGGTCDAGQFCDTASTCTCQPLGGPGASCNATSTVGVCLPDAGKCDPNLSCDSASCTCVGAPIIDWLSPLDSSGRPVGTSTNFVTIGGRFFGTAAGQVVFLGSTSTPADDKTAPFPSTVNNKCTDNWDDNQVIVVVPAGVQSGPIKLVRPDGDGDETGNNRGPILPDFKIEDVIRPGLCLSRNNTANPVHACFDRSCGYFEDQFNLQGINFNGAGHDVLLGGQSGSSSADSIMNWTNFSVDASVPDLKPVDTRVFVKAGGNNSNDLNFKVLFDAATLPRIDYIDPAEGVRGDYITIYGSNFGNQAGKVTFKDLNNPEVQADISFPQGCDNYWHNAYVVVKVPAGVSGASQVRVVTAKNAISDPADFLVKAGQAGPGLCKIAPHNGEAGQVVEAFGERFGNAMGQATFFNNQNGNVNAGDWSAVKVKTSVPAGAETGPFRLVDSGGTKSNSLNFMVGKCSANSDCDTSAGEQCCSGGNFDGICRTTCEDPGAAASCVYSWDFTTGATAPVQTCAGYSSAPQCLAAATCPNSPGVCSTEVGGVVASCDNAACETLSPACANGACSYDNALNKCKLDGASCDAATTTLIAGYEASCRKVGAKIVWQISQDGSCPAGSFKDTNGACTVGSLVSPLACSLCSGNLSCQAGQCVVNAAVCPSGSACQAGQCVAQDSSCECCCRIGQEAQDCCLGLTCAGTCGSDTTNDNAGYGQCTGCTVRIAGAVDQAASDAACNCSGHSLKYCDVAAAGGLGVCQDGGGVGQSCSQIQPSKDTVYKTKVIETANLVSYWQLDNGWSDAKGINNLNVAGAVPFDEARYGSTSAKFTGSMANYAIKNPVANFPTTEMSAEFWIKTSDTSHDGGIISYASSNALHNAFIIYNPKLTQLYVNNLVYTPNIDLTDGQWHHVVVTWRSAGGQANFYKDGNLIKTGAVAAGQTIQGGGSLMFGQDQDTVGGGLTDAQALIGQLDEVAIYSRALSADEVADHYDQDSLTASMCVPDNTKCQSNLSCDPTSCTCQPSVTPPAASCDADTTNASCDPDSTLCANPSDICDPTSCTCQPNATAGAACQDLATAACTVGVPACGADYSCLNNAGADCRCCCTPGSTNAAGLRCEPDQAPCTTGARGLFCGCKTDAQCGNAALDGCGLDTCCRPKPTVVAVEPAANAANVCRNPLIEARFDQPMDLSSFSGNVILVGDYKTSACPSNTTYLTTIAPPQSFLARTWSRVKVWFGGEASALGGNFCAVLGSVTGYDDAGTGTGVLRFAPTQVLAPQTDYYVIIKGDASSTDSTREGVLNKYGITMDTTAAGLSESFNSVTYYGKIWKFTTKPNLPTNNGICRFDKAALNPATYTFTAKGATTTIVAYPMTSDNSKIAPIPGVYDWTWDWRSQDTTVAQVTASAADNQTVTAGNKKDARTYINTQAKIITDTVNQPSTKNQTRSAKALIRLFLCANPWPPLVNPATWPWQDAAANCSAGLGGASCDNFNFEFYYCRDGGSSNDPALPSIENQDTVVRGEYNNLLKEFFFLRAAQPNTAGLVATPDAIGGRITLTWGSSGAGFGYKVYIGKASGKYDNHIDVGEVTSALIPNLKNGTKYYFAIKSYNKATGAEGGFSSEVSATANDTLAPNNVSGLTLTPVSDKIEVKWNANLDDTAKYKVYFGTASGSYGQSFDVGKSIQATITGLSKNVTYFVTVTAIDASGNESAQAAVEQSATTTN